MLSKDIQSISSTTSKLRSFGLTLGIFFGILFLLAWWRGHLNFIFLGIASFFLLFGIFVPNALKSVYHIWMVLGLLLGWVVTRVILSFIFYFVLFPTSLIGKLFGHSFFRPQKQVQNSYWVESKITHEDLESYKRQF